MFKTKVKPRGAAQWLHCNVLNVFDIISMINNIIGNGKLSGICFLQIITKSSISVTNNLHNRNEVSEDV